MFITKPQDMMKEYRKASVNAELAVADPYTITKALFQGVFERLGQAKGAIARGDLAEKAQRIASAQAIIQHLKDTLDPSHAPEIAHNLALIYDFMLDKLAEATIEMSPQPCAPSCRSRRPGTRFRCQRSRKRRARCARTLSTSSTTTTQITS